MSELTLRGKQDSPPPLAIHENTYSEILVHPFLQGVTHGTLTEERFRFYTLQDAVYLREYACALKPHRGSFPGRERARYVHRALGGRHYRPEELAQRLSQRPRSCTRRGGSDLRIPHQPRLHQLPAQNGYSGRLPRSARQDATMLLDLLGGRQIPPRKRLPEPHIPEVDRHLRRRGVRPLVEAVLGLTSSQKVRVREAFITSRYGWRF